MKCVVTKWLPIPEIPDEVLDDNGNWFSADFFSHLLFFVCWFTLAKISAPGHCHAKPDTE